MVSSEADEIRECLVKWGVLHAYLFGSVHEDRAGARSDVDVALLMPEPWDPRWGLQNSSRIEADLRPLLGRPVDVVFLNEASPLLCREAVLRGRPLMTTDVDERIRYEQRVRARYEDSLHIQSFFLAALRERLGA